MLHAVPTAPRFLLSEEEAPRVWRLPGERPARCPPWRARLDALDALSPGTPVHVDGGEPLRLPDLHDLLAAFDARGLRAVLHTDLPGLDDDVPVRPFAPHDVRFVARLPTADPARYAAWTGSDLGALEHALCNLRAFAYPVVVEIPVWAANVGELPETVVHALGHTVTGVDLRVVAGDGDDDPLWEASPRWDHVADALLALDAREPKPRPRLRIHGVPALALPLEALPRLHVDVDGAADDPWAAPGGYARVHGAPTRPDVDTLGRRRAWLATPPRVRPGFRGDWRDALVEAVSAVQIRDRHEVHAVILPLRPDVPALAATARHGLYVTGAFDDPTLRARFATLARAVRDRASGGPVDLPRLRALARVLRRGMKPANDAEPVRWREEGE